MRKTAKKKDKPLVYVYMRMATKEQLSENKEITYKTRLRAAVKQILLGAKKKEE